MENDEKKQNFQVYSLLIAAILVLIAGVLTLIPYGRAPEPNMMGYKSLCTFSPVSTVICLFASNTFYTLWKRKAGKAPYPEKKG